MNNTHIGTQNTILTSEAALKNRASFQCYSGKKVWKNQTRHILNNLQTQLRIHSDSDIDSGGCA